MKYDEYYQKQSNATLNNWKNETCLKLHENGQRGFQNNNKIMT